MTAAAWKQALRAALTTALRARDAVTVSVVRQALAALDNAEAAAPTTAPASAAGPIAGAAAGLGAGDVARRVLGDDEIEAVFAREQQERLAAAETLDAAGRPDEAAALRRACEHLAAVLSACTARN